MSQSRVRHRNGFYLATRVGRDVCLLGVGVIGLHTTPPSVSHFTDHAAGTAIVWALMLVAGTLASLAGVLAERPVSEIAGCSLVAGAFGVWTVAALTQADATAATVQVALVFVSAVFGQGYRVWMIANQRVRR